MNQRHLEILQHALGLDKYGQGSFYRNQYVTGPGSDDYNDCCDLVIAGLMVSRTKAPCLAFEDVLFYVTESGKEYVRTHSPLPPKLTASQRRYRRYRRYLAYDSSMSFREFLKMDSK